MKKHNLTALLLCGLLTLSACGGAAGVPEDTTSGASDAAPDETTAPAIELPVKDFGGRTFRIAGFSLWGDHWIYSDELNGDVLNDAVYRRNSAVEETYNVKFDYNIVDDRAPEKVRTLVTQSVTAGDGSVDLAFTNCSNASTLMIGGYLSELTDVPNIDLSHPWWDAGSVRDFSIDGKNYFAVNSLCLLADNFTAAVFYNKELYEDLQLRKQPTPYELVDSGEWTWDRMYEIAALASLDIDGDNKMTDKDQYGMSGSYNLMMDSMMNCNEPIIVKDKDDLPRLALDSQRASAVAEKLLKILADDQNVLLVDRYTGQYGDCWQDLMYPAFKEGRTLFIARAYVQYVYYFRDSDVTYGILPRPKYDKAQESYSSDVNYAWASALLIPRDVKDPEMVGLITEALSQKSLELVTPANYDVSIVNKQLRDTDSERMLDVIYASRHYDLGQFASLTSMTTKLTSMLKANDLTFASDLAAEKTSAEAKIAKFIEDFRLMAE